MAPYTDQAGTLPHVRIPDAAAHCCLSADKPHNDCCRHQPTFSVAPKREFYTVGAHLLYETTTEAMRV
jgi:hypothetical protein